MAIRTLTFGERVWARRVSAVVAITLLSRFIGFLYPVLVLRDLDRPAAALAFFFISSAYFVIQPVSGGPAMAMVRPIVAAVTDDERAQWMRAAMAAVIPGIAVALTVAFAACVTSDAPLLPMLLMVLGLSADTMYFQLLTSRHRYATAATYRLIANVGQLAVLAAVLVLGSRSVTLVIAIFAFSYGFGIAVTEHRQRAVLTLLKRAVRATIGQRRRLMVTAMPTMATGFAYSGITGLDTYLVRLSQPDLVAVYGAAKTLASPFLLVSLAVTTIVQPEAARADPAQASALRRRMLILGAAVATIAIAACWALSSLAIQLVYGSRFPQAALTLSWLGTGTTLLGIHTLLQVWCWGRGRYVMPLVSLGSGAVIAVVANLVLVPRVGAQGAGLAVFLGCATATCILVALTRTRARDKPRPVSATAGSTLARPPETTPAAALDDDCGVRPAGVAARPMPAVSTSTTARSV